jgi:Domain of Unknown Function with PDB structure (DUF3857)/Domain of Unknown Function with PDB structure (DUF3858)
MGQERRMNRIARLVACSAVLLAAVFFAVPRSSHADDWLPIAPEDLAMKDNPKQPGADAMILYKQVSVDVSKANVAGDAESEYYRIKIFTQEGTKKGHVEIEYNKTFASVVHVDGRTIRPDGSIAKFDGQVLETTVEKSSGQKVLAKSFTLPDVQPGCIIEYRYSIQGQPGRVLDWGWVVSESMYTREARFTYVPYGGYGNALRPIIRRNLLPADAVATPQANGSYLMAVHDIPGIIDEPMMPPYRPIQARVDFYYEDQDAPSATGPPDKFWNHYGEKWDGAMEKFIDKRKALEADLAKTTSPSDPPEVKLAKIYARVQKIRNLSLEDYKTEKEFKDENLKPNINVEDVLNHAYGYETQINYLFIGLARTAGLDASAMFIAPRNAQLFLPAANDRSQLSDDIVWVHAGSKDYFVDPAARYFPFGLLPWYETSTSGIKVDKHGGAILNTPDPSSSDATIVRHAELEIQASGEITGTVQVDYTGQRGALIREDERKEDEVGRTKYLETAIKRWLPAGSEFQVSKIANWDDNSLPVHVEGKLTIPSLATTAAQRMLMPLSIFQMSQTSEFASEKRNNPVYIHYPYEEIDDVKLQLPAGYKTEGVPPAKNLNLGAVSFEISATAQGDTVEVKRHLYEKNVVYTKDQYPALRRFFETVRTNDNAQMVFQNAESAHN